MLKFNNKLSSAYMDELFHIPQAQKYCKGIFNEVGMANRPETDDFYSHYRSSGDTSVLRLALVLSYVYSKQPIFGLTQEWFRELSFSRLECGVHDKLHISSADWWDLLLPLA